jgi:hypothetical protein
MLVVGNINKDEAITLAKMTEEIIQASPLPGVGPVDLSLELLEGVSSYTLRLSRRPMDLFRYQSCLVISGAQSQ